MEIFNTMEGFHMGLLRELTVNTTRQSLERTWRRAAEGGVLKEAVTRKLGTYIDKQQTTVAEWVTLRPIYDVCDKWMGY